MTSILGPDRSYPTGDSYLTDHQAGLGISVVLYSAAMLALIPFVAMIHRRIAASGPRAVAGGTFLVAGTACITLGLLGGLLQAALVQRIASVADDSTLGAWYAVWDMVAFTGPPLAITVSLLVAAAVLSRDGTFPRWLAAMAVVSAALTAVAVVADLATEGGAPTGVDFAGFLLANVWFVAVSVIVLRTSTSTSTSTTDSISPHPDPATGPAAASL